MKKNMEQLEQELELAKARIAELESLFLNIPNSSSDESDRSAQTLTQQLRNAEITLSKVQEIAHIGSWDWDVLNNTLEFSPELYRIYGITPAQFDGNMETLYNNIIHPDDKKYMLEALHQSIADKKPQPVHFRVLWKDGTVRYVWGDGTATYDENGSMVRMIGILQDITDFKHAEDAIRDSESRYRMIVETAQEGIWTIDTDNNTSFVNPVMANMLGYNVDEMMGQSMYAFMDDEGQKIATENVERRKKGIAEQHDFKFIHKNGSPVWAELNTSPLLDSNGVYVGALAMITDITKRRLAETALRDTQKLLLRTESLAQIGSWEWDLSTNMVNWSPEMYRIYQYDPDKFPKVTFDLAMSRTHPDDVNKIEHYVQKILEAGRQSSMEYRIVLPDESIRYLWSECDVISKGNESKSFMIGFVQDITERVLAENALREGNKRFKLLFEQSSFGVAKIDSQTGRFVEINQRYSDILGYSACEMLAMDFQSITVDQDLQEDLDNMAKLKAGEIPSFQMEKRYVSKNNSILWVNLSVVPLWNAGDAPDYHLAIVEDITERKLAEEKLQQQKEEQQQLINNIAESVIVIDENGVVQTFSNSAEKMFGYSADEILNHSINQLMPLTDSKLHDTYLLDYITTGDAHIIGVPREVIGRRKNGETFSMRLSVAELPRSDEGVRRFVGACHDVTLEKEREEQLRRSQKMDALGKLTGGIAHDYNNMLGVILGYSNLLHDALKGDSKLEKYVAEIHHASERGTKLSRKLLAFSRNIQPEATVVNINDMLLAEQDMLQKTLTPRIKLILDLVDRVWPIYVNSSDFEDAILNLCINAMHAMDSGGKLSIKVRNLSLSQSISRKTKLRVGDYVVVSVADTGCGIPEKELDFIFDPFFTTKGDDGVGLGLSMVYGFVNRSGGEIIVDSVVGKGSQFDLYFPRYSQLTSVVPKISQQPEENLNGSETILIVDDEPAMVGLAKEILTGKGYQTLTANSGREALSLLRDNSVDMLLSDVVMPEMDGYQLAAEVQGRNSSIKILLMSGYTDNLHLDNVEVNSKFTLLRKPFEPPLMLKTIRSLFDTNLESQVKTRHTVMVMDDDEGIQKLFEINLNKLGYDVVSVNDGEQAVAEYIKRTEDGRDIDVCILDISVPGGVGGKEAAQRILALNEDAKLIVSSGDTYGTIMENYMDFGFKAALEKSFDRKKMKLVLEELLLSDEVR